MSLIFPQVFKDFAKIKPKSIKIGDISINLSTAVGRHKEGTLYSNSSTSNRAEKPLSDVE
jgi:hypothetical protein